MLKHEFDALTATAPLPKASFKLSMLGDIRPRTLLWGYTLDRHSHHVYIEGGEIVVLVYRDRFEPQWDILVYERGLEFNPDFLVPNKRLYPEACDWETCFHLKRMGVYLPFTSWDDGRETEQYYGGRLLNHCKGTATVVHTEDFRGNCPECNQNLPLLTDGRLPPHEP